MSVRILVGDVLERIVDIPDDSLDMCLTSPPYWGLRDYGVDGQMGMEPTLAEHLGAMLRVFQEVRRVLKPEGSLWLNYGDCYATTPNGRSARDTKAAGKDDRTFRDKPFSTIQGNLKPKDLCMVPNRLAIALQDDGWWVRSEIIWGKPNGMPDSSGRYRPSTAHEKIWLLSKTGRMHYDPEAVRQCLADASVGRLSQNVEAQAGFDRANGGRKTNGPMRAVGGPRRTDKQRGHSRRHQGSNERWDGMTKEEQQANGRLLRNYEPSPPAVAGLDPADIVAWTIPTAGFAEAHFATFPVALAAPCIAAGCPIGGTVLDPFGGAGTTGLVADRMGRDAILIEINPEYAEMAKRRIKADQGMFGNVEVAA